jgi:hypothetical protein
MSFVDAPETRAIAALQKEWPQAQLKEDIQSTQAIQK